MIRQQDFLDWLKNKNISIEHPANSNFDNSDTVGNPSPKVEPIESDVNASNMIQTPLPQSASKYIQPKSPEMLQGKSDESSYERLGRLLSNPPLKSDYEPSKLRRAAGMIVGGLSGFAGGPKEGVEAATNIVDKPYRD